MENASCLGCRISPWCVRGIKGLQPQLAPHLGRPDDEPGVPGSDPSRHTFGTVVDADLITDLCDTLRQGHQGLET